MTFFRDVAVKYLFPDEIRADIYDVDLEALKAAGFKGLILDVDNTLKPPGPGGPGCGVLAWLEAARGLGFGICLLSNSRRRRVLRFSSGLGVYAISLARKPAAAGFLKAIRLLGCEPERVCVIGDQVFTDVLGARRLGLKAIYTRPVTAKEEFTVRLKRIPEARVIRLAMKNGVRP